MYKLVRLSNIVIYEHDDMSKEVISVDCNIVSDLPNDFDEQAILLLKQDDELTRDTYIEDEDKSMYVIWDFKEPDNNPADRYIHVTCEYVVFNDFIDFAEYEYKVYSSVAAESMGYVFDS